MFFKPGDGCDRRTVVRLDLDRGLDAQAELFGCVCALVAGQHPLLRRRIDDGYDAVAHGFVLSLGEAGVDLGFGIVRQKIADERHGALPQQAGGIALAVALDPPTLGILGTGVDAGSLQGGRIRPARMPVHVLEPGRPVAGDLIEHFSRRVGIDRDAPAAAANPCVLGQRCHGRLDRGAESLLVGNVRQVDVLGLRGAPDQMVVRILEAGQHQRACRQVVDLGALEKRRDIGVRADRRYAPVDQGNRTRLGLCLVHGEDARAAQHYRLVFRENRRRTEQKGDAGREQAGLPQHSRHGCPRSYPRLCSQGTRRALPVKRAGLPRRLTAHGPPQEKLAWLVEFENCRSS